MVLLSLDQLPSNCPDTHFSCTNKKCVTGDSLCNGNNDCGDDSDETIGCNGRRIKQFIKNGMRYEIILIFFQKSRMVMTYLP